MRLSEFIQKRQRTIVAEWVAFAATLEPWSKTMSRRELRDHAEEMLAALAADIESAQTERQQAQKSKGKSDSGRLGRVGKKHAVERLESGLSLDQLVSEYRALRASVLRLWEKEHGDDTGEVTRFNEAIDETLAESAAWYSAKMLQTRDQFLAILGHDLRNPLASIVMGAALLARPGNSEIKQLGVATRIAHSAERMGRMVDDLLDLTRTSLGDGIPVTRKPADLMALTQHVIDEMSAVHPDRKLLFTVTGDLRGEWDSDRLTQVLSNLVANALQYGSEDAAVTVAAEGQAENVTFRVHNNGTPISAKAQKTLFHPMQRSTSPDESDAGNIASNANPKGLGLGLFIAREIVTAHGGAIAVTSNESEGTTFTVCLPRRAHKARAEERVRAKPRTSTPKPRRKVTAKRAR